MKRQPDSPPLRTAEQRGFIPDTPKSELAKAGGPDISRLLVPGEQVVWERQQVTTNNANRAQITSIVAMFAIIFYALFWLMFSIFTIHSGDLLFTLVPILACIILIGFLIMRAQDKRARVSNYYWLTNRHAIIIRKVAASSDYSTTMIDLAQTDAVKMTERADGSGTLVFGRNAASAYSPATRSYVSNEADYSFSDIPNVAEVYRLVQEVQAAARQRS